MYLVFGSPIDGINESSKAMITAKTCLGEDGTVILYVISENGEKYRIQRTVSDLDKGPEVYYEETETKASDNVKSIFQCQIYSQNEIIELGKNLPALLNWLDSFIDLSNEKQEIESIKKQVEKLFKQLDEDYAVAIQLPDLQKRKEELEEKKKLLDQKVKEAILKTFPNWQQEERLLRGIQKGVDKLKNDTIVPLKNVRIESYLPEPQSGTPNYKEIAKQVELLKQINISFGTTGTNLEQVLTEKMNSFTAFVVKWREKFEQAQEKHEEVIKSAGVKNASAITSELNKVIQAIETIENDLRDAKKALNQKVALENTLRSTLMSNYSTLFSSIFKKRLDKAESISKSLEGFVRINVFQMNDRIHFKEVVEKIAKGSNLRKEQLQNIISNTTPIELAKFIIDRKSEELSKKTGIKEDAVRTFIENVWSKTAEDDGIEKPSKIYKIMLTELKDSVTVNLRVHKDVYKPMDELSGGSKCTAILSVALVESGRPLIVDQPEDALDNPFVFEQIVQNVRKTKSDRQYIFATHNPNIAVASDADLIYCLKATAVQGSIDKHGSIDEVSTRDKVVANLEGGENAFKLRGQKYDIAVENPSGVVLDVQPKAG